MSESYFDPRLTKAFFASRGWQLPGHLLALGRVGSHSHGTRIPDPEGLDDEDLMGIVVPPLDHLFGLPRFDHYTLQEGDLDVTLYSLDKTVRLLLKGNPNVVGFLWLRDEDYLYRHPLFQRFLESRAAFSSLATARAFAGYAHDQLRRMEAFSLERMTEYEALTTQIELAAGPGSAGGPIQEVLEADPRKLKHLATAWSLQPSLLERFRSLHKNYFSGYMGVKRKALVRRLGYDAKNAAHLIRLLRMGVEFLRTGEFRVYRADDAEDIKAIKRGERSLDEIKAEAERLFADFREAEAASTLPPEPDEEFANRLLVEVHSVMTAAARKDSERYVVRSLPDIVPDADGHGRPSTYVHRGCRCAVCREGWRRYNQQRASRAVT